MGIKVIMSKGKMIFFPISSKYMMIRVKRHCNITVMDLIEYLCGLEEDENFGLATWDGPNQEGQCNIFGRVYQKENNEIVIEGGYTGKGPYGSRGVCQLQITLNYESQEVLEFDCQSFFPDEPFTCSIAYHSSVSKCRP